MSHLPSSQVKVFKTELDRAKLIFQYWMRKIIPTRNISAHNYTDLVLKYLIPQFEWDIRRKHEALTISNYGKCVTDDGTHSRMEKSLCSKNILSSETESIVRWEMTLKQKGTAIYANIGYIDAKYISDFRDDVRIGYRNGVSLRICDKCAPAILHNGSTIQVYHGKVWRTKTGDKWMLEFDFKKKKCAAFYNGKFLTNITDQLPHKIHLAATNYYIGASFETTLFKAVSDNNGQKAL